MENKQQTNLERETPPRQKVYFENRSTTTIKKSGSADRPHHLGTWMSKRRRISGEAPPPDDGAPPGIRFVFIRNDGTAQHLIWLVQLKAIFSTQLPKMPPQYIVRLVFDRKHESLLMLKEHEVTLGGTTETVETVVGGVAFRVFDSQKCVSPPARPASLSLSLSVSR